MSFTRRAALAAAIATVTIALLTPQARAHDYKVGALEVGHPWTRATPPSAKVAGGYLSITNKGEAADRLLSASFVQSNSTEVHEMAHENGVMKMRELPKGIEIKAGARVELKPGGFHLMFIGLKAGLKEGDSFKGVLMFEKAGRLEVDFKVEPMSYKPKGSGAEHNHSGHGAKTQ
ncbi:MAG: copper chaperone PCu(A)C [Beijerinckiaceae bacterium]